MIRIAIADDQTLLREMLSVILSAGDNEMEVVGLAANGEEIIGICRNKKPDIVLMDIKMPVKDGFCALEAIKKEMPEIKVVMLTTFGDERNVLEAFKKGADGYVLKDIKPPMLVMTIKCVYEGLFVMQHEISSLLRKRIKISSFGKSYEHEEYEHVQYEYGLDTVDRKIIKLIASGKSNKEIAALLNYSEGSIKNRISRILDTTGLKDRTQIVVFALQNNII